MIIKAIKNSQKWIAGIIAKLVFADLHEDFLDELEEIEEKKKVLTERKNSLTAVSYDNPK